MDIATYILIAIVVCVVIFAKMALVIIPQSETKIIERLGRYYATLQPGINVIIPFIDRAKSIVVLNHGRYMYSTTIDLREQVYDFPKQNVITKDNVQTEINALLYFQIVDPFKATYEINNLPNAIEKLTQTNIDYGTRVIGYLKRVSNFSSARQAEHNLRYYHKSMLNRTIEDNQCEQQNVVRETVKETVAAEKIPVYRA